ncbi:efflux transporter outer membrane subunit [bacterium]|nr:MAG: efflux transporter outer membrane subunit [bacterium]
MIRWGHCITVGMLSAALAGCAVTADYHPPAFDLPARWSEAPEMSGLASAASPRWWTTFKDPQLDSLIERAVRANLDLQLAEARIREVRGRRGAAAASLWPVVDATASYKRERESVNAPAPVLVTPGGPFESPAGQQENLFQAGFDAAWEIDLFGGKRRSIEAAEAELEASFYDRGAVALTLLAEVARNYIDLRGMQEQIAVAKESLAVQKETLRLTQARYKGGVATDLDVAQAETQVEAIASQIPMLETSYKEAAHRLGLLLGQPPGALSDELKTARPIPVAAPALPSDLPSDLLRQRPDIRRAERQLAATTAHLGVATADLYPKFSLLGTLGLASVAAGNFFSSGSTLWSIGPSMTWPIFRGGQIVATIEVRDAQKQQALISYRQTILTALEDVENAIASYSLEQNRRTALARSVYSSERAVDLARELYVSGLTDFRGVLEAQRNLFQAKSDLARSDTALSTHLVVLHKALGGGWNAVLLPADSGLPGQQSSCVPTPNGGRSVCSTSP